MYLKIQISANTDFLRDIRKQSNIEGRGGVAEDSQKDVGWLMHKIYITENLLNTGNFFSNLFQGKPTLAKKELTKQK